MTALPNLIDPVYEVVARRAKVMPCHVNRASQLGHECERFLVYCRTNWQDRRAPDPDLQMIFDMGELFEGDTISALLDARIPLREQQTALQIEGFEDLQITGHVDGVLLHGDAAIPVEIKSMTPHIWDSVAFRGRGVYEWSEVAAAFGSKPWLRKYFAQLTVYMLGKGADDAILIARNKGTGAWAQINVHLDQNYGAELLAKAFRVNQHVAAGTLPDRILWDEETCGRCDFLAICLPDHVGTDAIKWVPNEEIARACVCRKWLADAAREYDRLDKRIKDWAKAQDSDRLLVPGFELTVKRGAHQTRVEIRTIPGAITAPGAAQPRRMVPEDLEAEVAPDGGPWPAECGYGEDLHLGV